MSSRPARHRMCAFGKKHITRVLPSLGVASSQCLHTSPRNLPTTGWKCHSNNLVLTKKPKLDWVWSLLFRAFISRRCKIWRGVTQKRKVQHFIISGGSLCVPPLGIPQSSGENKFRKSHWNSKWKSIRIITKVSKTGSEASNGCFDVQCGRLF